MATIQTHTIKEGDTGPAIQATLKGRTGAAQDLTGAAVKFNMGQTGATLKVDHGTCAIVGAATLGVVQYAWAAGDTDTPGMYNGEFEATLADGQIVSFPNAGSLRVWVVPQVA